MKEGGFYGWPYSDIGKNRDPRRKEETPLVDRAIVPDVLFTSHVAALGIQFYTGKMFPKEYQGDAFVAFHGSWNRAKLSGFTEWIDDAETNEVELVAEKPSGPIVPDDYL